MRQRRVTGIEERLAPYADLILRGEAAGEAKEEAGADGAAGEDGAAGAAVADGEDGAAVAAEEADGEDVAAGAAGAALSFTPRWYLRTSPRYMIPEGFKRVYAEIGCGRGLFINTLAAEDPECLYIGVEGCKTIVIRGLQKTSAAALKNVRFIDAFINDAEAAFGEEALAGIFLNFSDPWPKERHADRRLTAPAKAANYYRVLEEGGFISFKTDGESFFKYSVDTFINAGFCIAGEAGGNATAVSGMDTAERAAATPTEYELKFRAMGKPIYQFTAIKQRP